MVHMSSLMCTSFIYLFLDFFFFTQPTCFFFCPLVFLPFIWVKRLPEDYSKCFIRKNVITSWPFNKTAVSPRKNICSSAKRMSISSYPKCKIQSELSIFLLNWSWLLWEIVKKIGDSSHLDQGQSNSDSVHLASTSIALLWNGSSKTDHHLLFTPPLFIHSTVFSLWTWIPSCHGLPSILAWTKTQSACVICTAMCCVKRERVSHLCPDLSGPQFVGH